MSRIRKICSRPGCGCLTYATYCVVHEREHKQQANKQKNTHARRAVYDTSRWRKIRQIVLHTAEHTCQRCGRYDPTGRALVADHRYGVTNPDYDPFDIEFIDCLCLSCSGSKDGARSRQPHAGAPSRTR